MSSGADCAKLWAPVQHQLAAEKIHDLIRRARGDLQPHRRQLAPLFQQLAHHRPVVEVLVLHGFLQINVGIAGNPEDASLGHGIAPERQMGEMAHQLLHQRKFGHAVYLHADQPLELAAHRDEAESLGAVLSFSFTRAPI